MRCPFCREEVSFSPAMIKNWARKCPHCHEFVHPKGFFDKFARIFTSLLPKAFKRNVMKKIAKYTFSLLVAIAIALAVWLIPAVLRVESWPPWGILGLVAFMVIILSFLRPFNIQPAVSIAFITLLFVGLGILWQKQNFDLRNRPYINVAPSDIKLTGLYIVRSSKIGPEPEFTLELRFINQGPVPATIGNIIAYGQKDKQKLLLGKGVLLGPSLKDKQNQWSNADVFPFIAVESGIKEPKLTRTFYLGTSDIFSVFSRELSIVAITKDATLVEGTGNFYNSPFLKELSSTLLGSYYLLIQVEYYGLGEQDKRKEPYWYWIVFKRDEKGFTFECSGVKKKMPAK